MTDTLVRTLVIIWTRLAALLLPEQGDSLRLNLSLDSADWYQSCTFLAQEEEMKGRGKGGGDPHWHPYNSVTGILSPSVHGYFALGPKMERGSPLALLEIIQKS